MTDHAEIEIERHFDPVMQRRPQVRSCSWVLLQCLTEDMPLTATRRAGGAFRGLLTSISRLPISTRACLFGVAVEAEPATITSARQPLGPLPSLGVRDPERGEAAATADQLSAPSIVVGNVDVEHGLVGLDFRAIDRGAFGAHALGEEALETRHALPEFCCVVIHMNDQWG